MNQIKYFLENTIIVNWIAPLIIAAITGACGFLIKRTAERRANIPYRVKKKGNVDVFRKYCENNRIYPVISYGDSSAIEIATLVDKGNFTVKADIDLKEKPANNNERYFVMILLKYIPKANMLYFYENGYSFMFDIRSQKGVCGIQLEIKDINGVKLVDEFVSVEKEFKHYSFQLNRYETSEAWKAIAEICFTIFTEKKYILKNKGNLEIRNCMLKVEPKTE